MLLFFLSIIRWFRGYLTKPQPSGTQEQDTQSNSVPEPPLQSASNESPEADCTPVASPMASTGTPVTPPETAPILFYEKDDPYYEFTNFSPHDIIYKGKKYPTSEHLFQAFKFLDEHPEIARRIRDCGERPVLAFDEAHRYQKWVRSDWRQVHVEKMEIALYHKFTQHPHLKTLLLDTGDAELIEDSPRDYFWGAGADYSGRNELGKALMRLRTKLQEEPNDPTEISTDRKDTTDLAAQDPTSCAPAQPISDVNGMQLEEWNDPSTNPTARRRSTSLPHLNRPRSEERDNLNDVPTSRKRAASLPVIGISSVLRNQPVSSINELRLEERSDVCKIPTTHKDTSSPSAQDPVCTQMVSNVNRRPLSAALALASEPDLPQAAPPQDKELCEFCHRKPKFQNHPYCGRTCAREAGKMCSYCRAKPRFRNHPYCSRTCAAKAGGAA